MVLVLLGPIIISQSYNFFRTKIILFTIFSGGYFVPAKIPVVMAVQSLSTGQ